MKKFFALFAMLSLVSYLVIISPVFGQYSSFIPVWKIGDHWKVETNPIAFGMPKGPGGMVHKKSGQKVEVDFRITGVEEVDKTKCFVLKITNTLLPDHYSMMYIRSKDFTLKKFVEVSKRSGSEESKTEIENPSKPFMHQQMGILCPVDFPQFPNEDKDTVIKTTLGLSNNKLTEVVSFNPDKTEIRIEMKATVNGKVLKSVQYWNQGYPWWSKAERHWDKEKWEEGKLLSYKLVPRKAQ